MNICNLLGNRAEKIVKIRACTIFNVLFKSEKFAWLMRPAKNFKALITRLLSCNYSSTIDTISIKILLFSKMTASAIADHNELYCFSTAVVRFVTWSGVTTMYWRLHIALPLPANILYHNLYSYQPVFISSCSYW